MIPGIAEDQWIVFLPSLPGDAIASGHRYVFQIEEEDTGDWSLALKRLQPFTGGGLRVISDNLAAGIVDEVLVPAKSAGGVDRRGWLEHRETGARIRLHLVGRVLWPRDDADSPENRTLSRMIERLAALGMLRHPD